MSFTTPLQGEEIALSRINPQKNNVLIRRLARAPWWLITLLLILLYIAFQVRANDFYKTAWNEVKQGIEITLWISVVSYALALILGLGLALLRRPSRSVFYNVFCYQPATFLVETIRGIPTLVILFATVLIIVPEGIGLINSLGDQLAKWGMIGAENELSALKLRDVPPEYRGVFALAISYAAFLSEIFRAGLDSIGIGQQEAAASLGMSRWQVLRHVVLPQAIRNILPPLGNDFIAMLKESSLVSTVGIEDISRQGRNFNSATFTIIPGYAIIALTYLTMTLSLSILVKLLEAYLNKDRQRG